MVFFLFFFLNWTIFLQKLQFFLDFRALYNAESLINQQVIVPNNHYKIFNLYFFSFSKKERMNECSLITLTWCETWLRLSLRNSTTQIELKYYKSAILGIKLFASNDKIKDWEKKSVKVSPMKWWHKFLMWRLAQNFLTLSLIFRSLCNISTHKATKVMHDTSATKFSAKIATKIWDTTHYTIVICYKIAKKNALNKNCSLKV